MSSTQDGPPTTNKTFTGSCHCKAITYRATLPIPDPPHPTTATRCNCTICLKTGFTGVRVPDPTAPLESHPNFELLSPASLDETGTYWMTTENVKRRFCTKCGIHILVKGAYQFQGKEIPLFSLNVATLDSPQDGLELSEWKIKYVDGRTDGFMKGLQDTPWPSGLV